MNKHDSIQPDHGKRVTCAGRNTPSSSSIALCWVVPPWQVSALGGTWHDPLASLQLALREDVEETDHQLWNLLGILVPHLNISLFPIQDFHVLHIRRGPSWIFVFTPFSNSHFQDCFFHENQGKKHVAWKTSQQPSTKFMVEILLRELAFEGGAFTRRSRSLAPWYLLPPWMSGKSSPFWFPMSLGITSFEGDSSSTTRPMWEMGEIMLEGWEGLMNLMERWTGVYRCCPLLVSSSCDETTLR